MKLKAPEIRQVLVTRYVTPFREGGSLPALVEADDGFLYVLKFKGAGQGIKALIAELIGGELARALGFNIPELVFAQLDEAFGRTEADEEIQDLLRFSTGVNLGVHFLSGSITFDPSVTQVDPKLASQIVWFDMLLTNVDRTVRNTNMLMWHNELWLIDHGASLYFHHNWEEREGQALKAFPQIKDHVLWNQAQEFNAVHAAFSQILTDDLIESVVNLIPDIWLLNGGFSTTPAETRQAYLRFLCQRMKALPELLNQWAK